MSASSHPPGSASEVLATTTTTTTDDGAPGHRRAPSAPSIPTSYDFMDDSERAPPNPGPGAYSLAGDMNHRVGTGSIGVKGYGPLVSGAARLQAADARGVGGPGPGAYAEDVDRPFASSRVDFSSSAHPSAPFAKATRAGVTFERADEDETPGPAHYAAGAKPLASGIPGKGIWASDGRPRLGGGQSESRSSATAPGPHHYDSAPTRLGAGKPGVGATAAFSARSAEAVEATARRHGVVAHGIAVPRTAPKVISLARDEALSHHPRTGVRTSRTSPHASPGGTKGGKAPMLTPKDYTSLEWFKLDGGRVPRRPREKSLGSPWREPRRADPGFGVDVAPCALRPRGKDQLGEDMKEFTRGYYLKEYRIVDNVMGKELQDLTMMVEEDDWFD